MPLRASLIAVNSATSWRSIRRAIVEAVQRAGRRGTKTDSGYPGDHQGAFDIRYDPYPDNVADPGEVVWTWVPYEEDHSQGKDRPALIVGREGRWLLALPLTSKDHDADAAQEARAGRFWVDIGVGGWDRSQRESEARVDRVIRVNPRKVRRIGGRLDPDRFAAVAEGIRRHW